MSNIEMRVAKLSDVEQLSELFHGYRQLSASVNPALSISDSKDWVVNRIEDGSAVFLVAVTGGTIQAFTTLYQGFSSISLAKYWILNDLYVVDEARGLGLGRRLMNYAEAYAKETKAQGIELETTVDNHVAQSLYESLGYEEVSRYKRYFNKL